MKLTLIQTPFKIFLTDGSGSPKIYLRRPSQVSQEDFDLLISGISEVHVKITTRSYHESAMRHIKNTCPRLLPVAEALLKKGTERAKTALLNFRGKNETEMNEYCLILFDRFPWLEYRL